MNISLLHRLTRDIAWTLVSQGGAQGATFLSNVIIANVIGRVAYGEYATVVGTLLSISALAQFATGYTAVKYLAEFRDSDQARAGRLLGLCSVVSTASAVLSTLAVLLLSHRLAEVVFHAPGLGGSIAIGSLFLGTSIVNGFQMGALTGLEAYERLGKASLLSGVVVIIGCSMGAEFSGVQGAVTGLVIGSGVRWAVFTYFLETELKKHGIKTDLRRFREEQHVFRRFALPAALCGLSIAPSQWVGSVALVRQHDGFSQMAIYTAANSLLIMVLFIPRVADRVAMARINAHRGLRDSQGYRGVFFMNLWLTVALAVVGITLAVTFGPTLLRIFGRSFVSDGSPVLLCLMLGAIPEALILSMYQILQSNERMWSVMLGVSLPRDITFSLLALVLAHQGAIGLARAYLASVSLACVLSIIFAMRTGLASHSEAETEAYVTS